MEVNVTVRGPAFGPFGKPTTVTVQVVAKEFNLPSDLSTLVENAVVQTIAAYEAIVEAEREPEPAPIPGSIAGGPEPLEVGRDELAGLDEADIEAIRERPAPPEVETLPDPSVLEVTAHRVDVTNQRDAADMAAVMCPHCGSEHRHALMFVGPGTMPLEAPCGQGQYRILCDVELLAARTSERCGEIGEHEPHSWGLEGLRWCEGEVF